MSVSNEVTTGYNASYHIWRKNEVEVRKFRGTNEMVVKINDVLIPVERIETFIADMRQLIDLAQK